jgi:hypothetical protein
MRAEIPCAVSGKPGFLGFSALARPKGYLARSASESRLPHKAILWVIEASLRSQRGGEARRNTFSFDSPALFEIDGSIDPLPTSFYILTQAAVDKIVVEVTAQAERNPGIWSSKRNRLRSNRRLQRRCCCLTYREPV